MERLFIKLHSFLNNFTCAIEYKNKKAEIIYGKINSGLLREVEDVFLLNKINSGYIAIIRAEKRYRVHCYGNTEQIKQQLLNTVNNC